MTQSGLGLCLTLSGVTQPRSKAADSAPAEGRSSIFGAAKPVDTASREQEIEIKLRREEEKRVEEEEVRVQVLARATPYCCVLFFRGHRERRK